MIAVHSQQIRGDASLGLTGLLSTDLAAALDTVRRVRADRSWYWLRRAGGAVTLASGGVAFLTGTIATTAALVAGGAVAVLAASALATGFVLALLALAVGLPFRRSPVGALLALGEVHGGALRTEDGRALAALELA